MLCREHGQQLTELHNAATTNDDDDGLNGFDLFGIIKETGVVRDVNVCCVIVLLLLFAVAVCCCCAMLLFIMLRRIRFSPTTSHSCSYPTLVRHDPLLLLLLLLLHYDYLLSYQILKIG